MCASSRPVLRLEPLTRGRKLHDEISRQGLLEHAYCSWVVLSCYMYAWKCGALRQAQSVLEKLPSRDVVYYECSDCSDMLKKGKANRL